MFNQETADAICARLAEGESMRQICASDDMPDRTTVLRWMAADDAFAAKCARARSIQADGIFEGMADIEDQVLMGDLKADAARVVLSSRQWRASKLAPKKYGDKIELGGSLDVNTKIERITRRIVDGTDPRDA